MNPRQTRTPRQWLIIAERNAAEWPQAVRALRTGSGVLVLFNERRPEERQKILRRLRLAARSKRLAVVDEATGSAARVHDLRELRRPLLARTPLILLSPMFPTRSHPDWRALPRMRAAAFARLAGRRLIALGGMTERRFRQVEPLGFQAWAGMDAFRT